MKLDIVHDITYRYDAPVRSSTQYFRLTPRESPRHRVLEWAVDTPVPATRTRDGYGNVLHVLTLDKPVSEIRIRAHGVVETHPSGDAPGAGSDLDAGLSPLVFRRTTQVTRVDEALAAFADKHRKRAGTLAGLRDLAGAIEDKMPFKPDEISGAASAAEAFAGGVVSVRDQAHVFIACCRHLEVPARFVSGHLHSAKVADEGRIHSHAWAEAWVGDQWRGFDLSSDRSSGEHLALAIGADYLDACPIRGVRTGGGIETMEVSERIRISG